MKTAVITTGGKQYVVQEGAIVAVDRLAAEEGKKVVFDEVLLAANGKDMFVGTPLVSGAEVEGEIVAHERYPKVFGVKMKSKKRHKKYFGHKQPYTSVKITKIASK